MLLDFKLQVIPRQSSDILPMIILATTDQIRQVSHSFCVYFGIFLGTNKQIMSIYVENDQIWSILKKKDPLESSENWWFVVNTVLFPPKSLQFSI